MCKQGLAVKGTRWLGEGGVIVTMSESEGQVWYLVVADGTWWFSCFSAVSVLFCASPSLDRHPPVWTAASRKLPPASLYSTRVLQSLT